MIVYKKASPLRLRRAHTPEPPFWAAATIAPYGNRRALPVAIDYLDLRASYVERLEVTVTEHVRDELERARELHEPVLIEATEFAELVFRRGEEALQFCRQQKLDALHLISTRGALPAIPEETTESSPVTFAIAAWPLELYRLEPLFAEAAERRLQWGVAVPIMFPVTTDLAALSELTALATRYGATFLASIPLELDPTAKHAIAQSLALEVDDETYTFLFHADLEPIHVATERHIAGLAAENGMADFIVPPRWEQRSNWNAAIFLTLTAGRMIAMRRDTELAGLLARSARVVAELDKPLERIAAAASLSIVQGLDDASVDILSQWLESGRSTFVERINGEWRLRRDHGT